MSENPHRTGVAAVGMGDERRKGLPGPGTFYAGTRVEQNKLTSQAPGFPIIDPGFATRPWTPQRFVPEEGLECATRAFLSVID
jgi:hypothetical protein